MNSDNFLIEEFDIEQAQKVCRTIENPILRQRAVANALAGIIANKYFGSEYEVDTTSGIYNIPQVLTQLDIADIYLNNNFIDVRLYFNENELCVPKSHFDNEIQPIAYMFIKLDETVSGGLVTGFIQSESIDTSININGYIPISENDLVSFYDIEAALAQDLTQDIPDNINSLIYDFLDNTIKNPQEFYKLLLSNKYAREKLYKSAKAQDVFKFVSLTKEDTNSLAEPLPEIADMQESETESLELADTSDNFEDLSDSIEDFSDEIDELPEANITDTLEPLGDSDIMMGLDEPTEDFEELEPQIQMEELPTMEDDTVSLAEENLLTSDDDDTLSMDTSNEVEEIEEIETIEEIEEIDNPAQLEENETYSTMTTPSLNSFEEDSFETIELTEDSLGETDTDDNELEEISINESINEISMMTEDSFGNDTNEAAELTDEPVIEKQEELTIDEDVISEDTPSVTENVAENITEEDEDKEELNSSASDELEVLFNNGTQAETANNEPVETQDFEQNIPTSAPAKKQSGVVLLGAVALIAALAYYGVKTYLPQNQLAKVPEIPAVVETKPIENTEDTTPEAEVPEQEDAMPNETIENKKTTKTEEGLAVSIPAIENNLDASVLVSNLKISWEVPASYVSNSTAKRYLTKLGKIIQLNLKSELLLLTKAPISNKVALELEMDKTSGKLKLKNITATSGESTVDSVIKQTVNKVLDMNLNINTSSLTALQGNPVLVVRF